MDRKSVSYFLQLCKKNDRNLINIISSDPNLMTSPESIAQKYNIDIDQAVAIKQILNNDGHENNNNVLLDIFDKYQSLVGGKGGRGKRKSKHKKKKKNDSNDGDSDQQKHQQKHHQKRQEKRQEKHHNKENSMSKTESTNMKSINGNQTNKDPAIQKILTGISTLLERSENLMKQSKNLMKRSEDLMDQSEHYTETHQLSNNDIRKIASKEVADILKKIINKQDGGNNSISHESSDMSPVILSD